MDSEKQAWEAVLPLVSKLKDFYLFSKELGEWNNKYLLVLGVSIHLLIFILLFLYLIHVSIVIQKN